MYTISSGLVGGTLLLFLTILKVNISTQNITL